MGLSLTRTSSIFGHPHGYGKPRQGGRVASSIGGKFATMMAMGWRPRSEHGIKWNHRVCLSLFILVFGITQQSILVSQCCKSHCFLVSMDPQFEHQQSILGASVNCRNVNVLLCTGHNSFGSKSSKGKAGSRDKVRCSLGQWNSSWLVEKDVHLAII